MKKSNENLIFINAIFTMCLIISNLLASKLISVGWFLIPSAVLTYGVTFLTTDIIGEIWGKEEANKTVKNGFIVQLMALVMIWVAVKLPPAPFMIDFNEKFTTVLLSGFRVTLGSLTAYIISQTNDVFIFHHFKNKHGVKHKWIRNNLSTMTSQFIDTLIFIFIAFYGVIPNIWSLVVGQYLIKVLIAIADTPFFYLLTKNSDHQIHC